MRGARAGDGEGALNRAASELTRRTAEARKLLARRPLSDEDVHQARKAVKKARAALRLLRPGIPARLYREQNLLLRDAGRGLSRVRDARSQLDALSRLPRRFGALAAGLRAEQARARAELHDGERRLARCLRLLEQALARAKSRPLRAVAPEALERGLRRLYRQGRNALRHADEQRSTEALHEWRKQVKYLCAALALVGNGQAAGRLQRRAERVAERLGDDHDLALLASRHPSQKKLGAHVARRRMKLQRKALAEGGRVYAEKPKRFARRVT